MTGSKAEGGLKPAGAKKVEQVSAAANSADAPARGAPEDPLLHNERHALHNSDAQVFAMTIQQNLLCTQARQMMEEQQDEGPTFANNISW